MLTTTSMSPSECSIWLAAFERGYLAWPNLAHSRREQIAAEVARLNTAAAKSRHSLAVAIGLMVDECTLDPSHEDLEHAAKRLRDEVARLARENAELRAKTIGDFVRVLSSEETPQPAEMETRTVFIGACDDISETRAVELVTKRVHGHATPEAAREATGCDDCHDGLVYRIAVTATKEPTP